jgi:hypothetical protein
LVRVCVGPGLAHCLHNSKLLCMRMSSWWLGEV